MTQPTLMNVGASDLVEIELWLDPVIVEPTNVGHINGELPFELLTMSAFQSGAPANHELWSP